MSLLVAMTHAEPTTVPTARAAGLVASAKPGDALVAAMQAMVDGDEAKYRQFVDVRSPHGYSEGYIRWVFASARLHQAVAKNEVDVKDPRGRDARLSTSIAPPLPPDQWKAMRAAIDAVEWVVEGQLAYPTGKPAWFGGGTQGNTTVERSGDGWIVVIADPVQSAPPEHLEHYRKIWSATSAVIDNATEQVRAGKLKSILEINNYVKAETNKIEATR